MSVALFPVGITPVGSQPCPALPTDPPALGGEADAAIPLLGGWKSSLAVRRGVLGLATSPCLLPGGEERSVSWAEPWCVPALGKGWGSPELELGPAPAALSASLCSSRAVGARDPCVGARDPCVELFQSFPGAVCPSWALQAAVCSSSAPARLPGNGAALIPALPAWDTGSEGVPVVASAPGLWE